MSAPRGAALCVLVGLGLAACGLGGQGTDAEPAEPSRAPRPDIASAPAAEGAGEAVAPGRVLVFAGDIAAGSKGSASYANARATASLVRSIGPAYVLTGGDNAYPDGRPADYTTKYAPTWGSFKGITKPVPGNHDYHQDGAAGYYGYFFRGEPRGHRYYAFGAGAGWRVYALNCEIPCGAGSAQEAWLRKDLAAHPGRHILVTVHRPRFTSGPHGPYAGLDAVWRAVTRARGDLVLAGHNHHYERFRKQDAAGNWRPDTGLLQMVVGTGGAALYPFPDVQANSVVRKNRDFGVLKLTLRSGSYSWQFLGSGRCYGSDGSYDCPTHRGKVLDSGTRRTNRPG